MERTELRGGHLSLRRHAAPDRMRIMGEKTESLEYLTIGRPGESLVEEKKSRFLGLCTPVHTPEEVTAVLQQIRKKHYEARHNCYAYVLGSSGMNKRSSDDGEPSGTAGAPILRTLESRGITDALIVVTRYFGGTLLGTGGLTRAYSQAAAAALDNAGIVRMCLCDSYSVRFDYTYMDRIQYFLREKGITQRDPVYAEKVTIPLVTEVSETPAVMEQLRSITGGKVEQLDAERDFFGIDFDRSSH